MSNGLGIAIPAAGAAVGTVGNLWLRWLLNELLQKSTKRGYYPGTQTEDFLPPSMAESDIFRGVSDPEAFISSVNEAVGYDPKTIPYWAQLEANEAARGRQIGYADKIVELFKESPMFALAEETGKLRPEFETRFEERETKRGKRIEAYDIKGEEAITRMTGYGEDIRGRAQTMFDNPNVMTQAEMDTMVGRAIGSNAEAAARRAQMAQSGAARRGLSPAAIAALQQQGGAENRRQNLESIANVIAMNAAQRPAMMGAGLQGMTAAAGVEGLGSDIDIRYGGLSEGVAEQGRLDAIQLNADLMASLGLETDILGVAEGRVGAATALRGSLEQPPNFSIFGDILSERGVFNTMIQAQGLGGWSEAFADLGSTSMDFLGGQLGRKAMPDQPSAWESFLGPLGAGAGAAGTAAGFGALFGEGAASIGLFKAFIVACLAANTEIATEAGTRRLADIQLGERVLTPVGYAKVVAKDFGAPHESNNNFVRLVTTTGNVVLTKTHKIAGRPVSDLHIGDEIPTVKGPEPILTIQAYRPVAEAGDLRLEGELQTYAAGGVYVESML